MPCPYGRTQNKRRYPWEDKSAHPNFANYSDTGIGATSTVGCFPGGASPYGCEEMSGNVWERCQTKWRENYKQPPDENLDGTALRVLRGGAFSSNHGYVRCADRYWHNPDDWGNYFGFRVVLSPCF